MKLFLPLFIFILFSADCISQNTFKAGFSHYQTGYLIHEYNYIYTPSDSIKLIFTDSAQVLLTPDSLVSFTIYFSKNDKAPRKNLCCLNPKKQVVKTEEYSGENLLVSNEWRYDDKDRKLNHVKDDKVHGVTCRETFDYTTDKKTGEKVTQECSYNNGKIEFYTKSYFDKNNMKYKEVRLNDNNKDIVHIESFTYGENGRVKERSVYFPEWKVTKHFEEKEGSMPAKCFRPLPLGIPDKITIDGRVALMQKVMMKNKQVITDTDCEEFEYKFTNRQNCDIIVSSIKGSHNRKVTFRYKEKVQ